MIEVYWGRGINLTSKINEISFLQVFGITLVVLGHSEPTKIHPELFGIIYNVIYAFHMPLFMVISGFLFTLNYSKYNNYFLFLKSKCERLLFPYIFLNLLAIFPKLILDSYSIKKIDYSWYQIFLNFFFPWDNIITYLWFLPTLFIIFIFKPFLNIKKMNLYLVFIMTFLFIYIHFFNPCIQISFMNIRGVCNYFIFFWLGCIIALLRGYFENMFYSGQFLIIVTGAFLFLYNFHFESEIIQFLVAILGSYFSFSLSYWMVKCKCNVFSYFYGYSYQIYLLSWFSQAFVKVIVSKIMHVSFYPTAFFMFIFGMLVPVIVCKYIKKNNIKIGKIIGM